MKHFLHQISSVLMAIVVLFSTMSFTLSEHYCGGDLVDSSLFTKVDVCSMDLQKSSSENDSCDNNNNCCKDIIKHIEGQSDLKINFSSLNLEQQQFVASFAYTYMNLFEGIDKNNIPVNNYSSPLVDKDITVFYRVFRI